MALHLTFHWFGWSVAFLLYGWQTSFHIVCRCVALHLSVIQTIFHIVCRCMLFHLAFHFLLVQECGFSCVHPFMLDKISSFLVEFRASKRFFTVRAGIRFFTSMEPFMPGQIDLVVFGLPFCSTLKKPGGSQNRQHCCFHCSLSLDHSAKVKRQN